MVCHYCGYEEKVISVCPSCGSPHIGAFKAGTQQVEELIKKNFRRQGYFGWIWIRQGRRRATKRFFLLLRIRSRYPVGTQMIVKGHDFPNVTLVGILAADMSLYSNDYRAGERTFQLLTQAAGRAGRGSSKGEVIIQTYSPQHYSIQMAAAQDYEGFYKEEMDYRELMGYPPVEQLLAVLMTGPDEACLRRLPDI